MSNTTAGGNETIPWGWICSQQPNLAECADVQSYYPYRLSLAANAAFLALFAVLLIAYLATYAVTRRGLGFTVAMALGLICEVLGYAGRVMSWKNQWLEDGFLMQICCLTIGPAFMAAGVYLCLRRIVYTFGPENSRIRPEYYTRIVSPLPPSFTPSSPQIHHSPTHTHTHTHNRAKLVQANDTSPSSSPATSSPSSSRPPAAAWRRWRRTTARASTRATTS